MFSRHLTFWALFLSLLLGAGWYKSVENHRDRQRQSTWRQKIERLGQESRAEYKRTVAWVRSLFSPQPDARQQVEKKLKDEWSVRWGTAGERDVAHWTHKKYGIPLRTEFEQNMLVAYGARSGDLQSNYPQPPQMATSSRAEFVRRSVADWGGWLWLAVLSFAIVSGRCGLLAAETMLAISMVCGVAWLTAPNYTITVQGILSNDSLFYAAVMYVVSLACLGHRLAAELLHLDCPLRFRFSLRSLLVVTAIVAVLLGMGPFGYFSLCLLVIGAALLAARIVSVSEKMRDGREPSILVER